MGKKIGSNPLSKFMGYLSKELGLSKMYTNHSIRVTATTFLGRNQFTNKQIMSVTGHRSVNSLAIYQKVSTNEKIRMGLSMNFYVNNDHHQILPNEERAPLRPILPKGSENMKRALPICTDTCPVPVKKVPVTYNPPIQDKTEIARNSDENEIRKFPTTTCLCH